jgi:hypothetical protein
VAAAYLDVKTRTVGWYVPGTVSAKAELGRPHRFAAEAMGDPATRLLRLPEMHGLNGGFP